MDSIIIYQDNLDNHIEQVIGILSEKKLIGVVFSKNFGANNYFFILKDHEIDTEEIIGEAKNHLGNITDFSIKINQTDSFENLLNKPT